jgi:histidine ammonia-lyase
MNSSNSLTISAKQLTLKQIAKYLQDPGRLTLNKDTKIIIEDSRKVIDSILKNEKVVYGVNTGFGKFSEKLIKPKDVEELQKRLIMSHAAGVGRPMSKGIARLMMLLKIKSLANGYSGCRLEVVQMLVEMLNRNVIPVIPRKGSVGASGDLAPLAHMALVMMGEGSAYIIKGTLKSGMNEWLRVDGKTALEKAGLKPLTFEAKEGLALINGTQAVSAFGIWTIIHAQKLLKTADIVGAMSLEALNGTLTAFDERIQQIRNHPGQITVAKNIRNILEKSQIVASHKKSSHRVQDAYSLRCIPQVHGAARDALGFIESVFINEANGVTDNPLVFSKTGEVLSGGNFHGAPVAYASDYLSIVLTDLASMSERRIEHMLDPAMSELPAFLAKEGGINSGFMIAHVTAASLVSENKVLAHPASIDSIPTSANKEDHVSMGTFAARKTAEIAKNLETILAIELLCACQALEMRAPLKPSKTTSALLAMVRTRIPFWDEDRLMYKDINMSKDLIHSERLLNECEKIGGNLS